jgi:hypothetical protein
MALSNSVDLEVRVEELEEWRETVDAKLFPELLALKRIATSTAEKVDFLIDEGRTIGTRAAEAKSLAEAALAKRDSVLPKMREQFASYSSEIEETVRNAKGRIEQASRFAASSTDPEAIKPVLTKLLAEQALVDQATAYRDWKKTVSAVAQKITWGLLALAGAGALHAARLLWQLTMHH